MPQDAKEKLAPLGVFIGEWSSEATHPAFGDAIVSGDVRFAWLSGERFLILRADNTHGDFPDSVGVIGVMEGDDDLSMQYFDSRGVHRIYRIAFDGAELRIWRDAPGFAQRLSARLSTDGSMLQGVWQLNERDQGFADDLAFTWRRRRAKG